MQERSTQRKQLPNNLPLALTSFVGREREIGAIEELLGHNRLLTLTGPGGSGKTRLASVVASGVAEGFEEGVWWVDLASLPDPTLVSQAVASSLDLRGAQGRALNEVLVEYLETKNLLLVLDNCEHLIDACAALADTLLRSCPELSVLATSREALSVAEETVWPVPPLSSPEHGRTTSLEELGLYESVRLFVARARSVSPSFELTERNTAAVSRLCQRLEGMPLALELAAAWVRVLTVEQIASRLNDSLRLLKTDSRTADPRQRTLKKTIEWSFELLSEEEQTLFWRLSVFSGGWTLAAAEEVCAGEGETLDLLSRLVDKSLVFVVGQQGEEARYGILETIQQYGAQILEDSGEGPEVRRRHAEYYLALAKGLEPAMWGAEEAVWLGRLQAEHDNLRAALSWAIEQDAELGLELAGALRWYWYWRGHYGEGRGWLDKALAKSGPGAPVAARAKALHAVGWLAHDQGDMDRAETAAKAGIELSKKAEIEDSLAASFRNQLGEVARHQGDFERATALFEEGTALYREAEDSRGVAWGLFLLGNASSLRGNHERARALYEEGLALCEELGGAQPLGDYLAHLGYEFLVQGDHERAATLNERAAALLRNQGYKGGLQFALNNLGWVALVREARERAEALYGEGLLLCRDAGDRLTASESIEGLACVAGIRGEAQRAAKLFGAAGALREAVGYRHAPRGRALREPHLKAARAQADKEAWEVAWAVGRAMTMEQAVEYALGDVPAPSVEPVPPTQAAPVREKEEEGQNASSTELRIFALGQARVELGKHILSPSDWTYAKSRELLFYLLSHPPRTRDQIGLYLWPDASPSRLRKGFHNAVYYLRKALGDQGWILFEGGRYSFNRSLGRYSFDAEAFEMNLAEARRLETEAPGEAISLYKGDFLEGSPGAEWVLARQDELRRSHEEALIELGRLLFEGERYAEAAEAYRKAIAFDRYSEIAHRRLMRCYARMGKPGRALLHYRDLARMLGEELGASPAAESAELYERLRRGENL